LADRLVELGMVDGICPEAVLKVLKNKIKPWIRKRGGTPSIDCVDERQYQLLADHRPGLPMQPGSTVREDYTYERRGTCNLFVVLAPEKGWRDVVTEDRKKEEWGRLLVRSAEEVFANARKIHLVCDNLNTQKLEALYLVLPPEGARKRARRFPLHPTPKHASWLNMAEIEISALDRQCLDRRIWDIETLRREVAAWVKLRNEAQVTVHWQFTSRDARQRLARSYPKIKNR
jgi:hypothetical protein